MAAIVSLGLGIGATAVFSFADAVFFKPLPIHDPGRLFTIREQIPAQDHSIRLNTMG